MRCGDGSAEVAVPLAALLLLLTGAGRIAGTVDFRGRALAPQRVPTADPACKGAVAQWEPRALVRITRNAPGGPLPTTPVVLEAKGCMYRPWLQGAMKGQKIVLRNADGTTHSVRAAANGHALFNVIQPPDAGALEKDPLATEVVAISCDLHPWMKAWVVISDHPFFTVTALDGSFELAGVPAGTYRVEAWNDRLGTLSAEVVVEDGKSVDPRFSFSRK